MKTLDRYLGVATSGRYLAYSLIIGDVLRKAGAISLRCNPNEHPGRIHEAFKLLKSDMEASTDTRNEGPVCFVGMRSYHARSGYPVDPSRHYNHCRIRTIVEFQADSVFRTKAVLFRERELFQTIARITNERISSTASLISCCRKRLTALSSVEPVQFAGIAMAWATVVCLKRKLEMESMKLDSSFMERVESKIMQDKIIIELMDTMQKEKDEKIASELQQALHSRVNSLIDKHLDKLA